MRVAAISSYPVKSCHRVDHDGARVEPGGLAGDRRWVVVDARGTVQTQREFPGLTGVYPIPSVGGLILRHDGLPDLAVPEPRGVPPVTVTLSGAPFLAGPAGRTADGWLAKALGADVRLAWLEDAGQRAVEPEYAAPGDRVGFADGYPLLVTNEASLDALNGWLRESGSPEGPLPMNRFRPNVVVSGAPAWAEDGWLGGRLRIGDVVFRAPKPCNRCVVTTTDQDTGVRGHEPLRTLARYRKVGQKLLFGLNLIPDGTGTIAVGDLVHAIPRMPPRAAPPGPPSSSQLR